MKHWSRSIGLVVLAALAGLPAFAQTAPATAPQSPAVKAAAEEVLLDIIVRDKEGKPVTDLKPEDLRVTDNGAQQTLASFRLVRGAEAISQTGVTTTLDPLRQLRLVTLAFEPTDEVDQRKLARSAAMDLVKGEQGTNVYYSVVVISNRLLAVQPFTNDKPALASAIERATGGFGGPRLVSDAQGRIPYVMTISAAAIPPGNYEIRATARQSESSAEKTIPVTIEAM
ncbi:MAG: VWA domain-containing protein [Acidobacteriia bacterium]|nr:VWA domain-containing protein [Terriglobia bacterium]